ncbi:MAG: hypothetical protein U5K54_11870 [Cytophagales bacterium]|nr:hypothetical protein [Cytophagales bacterium]
MSSKEFQRKMRSEIPPGAVPFDNYIDSLYIFLYTVHNIERDKVLLGQSSCTDDVINTKDSFIEHHVEGPFNLGGLAGLPFTGIWIEPIEHVPDSGAALILWFPTSVTLKKRGGVKSKDKDRHYLQRVVAQQ